MIIGHAIRLEQALVNLLDNAVKFNQPGGEARIDSGIAPDGRVYITVSDTGSGIPVEELSLSRGVDISDLDLSRWGDVRVLDDRVRQAAYEACGELNRQYPDSLYPAYQSSDRDCVVRATNEGRAQARWAVANWRGYPVASAPPAYSYQRYDDPRYAYPPPYGE